MRVIFVGEAPRRETTPFDVSGPGSGRRLAGLLGIKESLLHSQKGWEFVNLFNNPVAKWEHPEAFRAAFSLCLERVYDGKEPGNRIIVMLGKRVARAFSHREPFFVPHRTEDGIVAVSVPHPSGLCRLWNDARNKERFRKVMTELGVLPSQG